MRCSRAIPHLLCALACAPLLTLSAARAQSPMVDDPSLRISTYLDGLSQPTGMRFFGSNEGFVIEKASGQVQFFNAPGAIASTALNLNVQSDGERGLLGIALDPRFKANNPYVYLYYSATSASGDWTGNQLAKYQWNSQTQKLTATATTRTISTPAGFPVVSFHNGGPLVFGSDGNLYGVTGDLNRQRGRAEQYCNDNQRAGGRRISPEHQSDPGGRQPVHGKLRAVVLVRRAQLVRSRRRSGHAQLVGHGEWARSLRRNQPDPAAG